MGLVPAEMSFFIHFAPFLGYVLAQPGLRDLPAHGAVSLRASEAGNTGTARPVHWQGSGS